MGKIKLIALVLALVLILPATLFAAPQAGDIVNGHVEQTMIGYRLPITVSVKGITKTLSIKGILDTGCEETMFPERYLQSLGFSPIWETKVQSIGKPFQAYVYVIPFPTVNDIPLGKGEIAVLGTPDIKEVLIGCDILSTDNLSLHNKTWTLSIPKN